MEKLVSKLKMATHNVQVIHRNMYGIGFLSAHQLTETYYQYLIEMTDEVIEMFMSLGFQEPSLDRALRTTDSLKGEKIKFTAGLNQVRDIFLDLIATLDKTKETLPHDLSDRLEEHKIWLRVEADFTLARILSIVD